MKPIPAAHLGTPYGRHGKWWSLGIHKGIDYPARTGTPVHAVWGGRVVGIGGHGHGWGPAFGGHAVVVDQDRLPDGSPGLWAVYAHLSQAHVTLGQHIAAGDLIGNVGAEGNVTGPHLHYEVQKGPAWRAWASVNPSKWINAGRKDTPA
jgi:murein DD-endopeptidase MepM/ murein hydrolase activator NlpD